MCGGCTSTSPAPSRTRFRITIADNASTDRTPQVAAAARRRSSPRSRRVRLEQKGRGRALRTVWSASDAPVLAYMDVDLSTDLNALLPLVAPLISGPLGPGDRLPARPQLAGGARRRSGSSSRAPTTSSCAARSPPASPTRSAGSRRSARDVAAAAAAAGRGHRLVLRHRDAGARRARGAADPRGAGRLGRRPRLAPCTSCRRRPTTSRACGGWGGRWRPARCRWTGSPGRSATIRATASCPACPAGWPASSSASVSSAGCRTLLYLLLYSALPARSRARRSPTRWRCWCRRVANTAANRRLTFGVRGRDRRRPPPGAGPGRLRHRPRADQRLARRPRRGRRRPLARHRTGGADRRQPRGDRAALPALPRLGLPRPRRAADDVGAPPPHADAPDARPRPRPQERSMTAAHRPVRRPHRAVPRRHRSRSHGRSSGSGARPPTPGGRPRRAAVARPRRGPALGAARAAGACCWSPRCSTSGA